MRCPLKWLAVVLVLSTGAVAFAEDQPEPTPEELAAIKAIEALGGTVRVLAANSSDQEVDFNFRGGDLDDDGLAHIAKLPSVVVVNLRGTSITDAGLAHMAKLTKLRRLHLEKTKIGDAGLAHLAGLTNLEYLNLYGTSVTDEGLAKLKGLKQLKSLYVWQTDVTDDGVDALYEALPQLSVVRGAEYDAAAGARQPVVIPNLRIPIAGKPWRIEGITYAEKKPGPKAKGRVLFKPKDASVFQATNLTSAEDGTLQATLPAEVTGAPLVFYIEVREPGFPRSTYPTGGAKAPAEVTPDGQDPVLAADPTVSELASYNALLTWVAATDDRGLAGYRIYRGGGREKLLADENKIADLNAKTLTYQDPAPPAGQKVWYAAVPVDLAGRVGEPRAVQVDIPKDTPPKNEMKLSASAGSNAVILNWTGKTEPDVTHLLVFRSEGDEGEPQQVAKLDDLAATRWIDKRIEPGSKYQYHVKLQDKAGLVSTASDPVLAQGGLFVRRINCGGPKVDSPDGQPWEADQGAISGTGRFTAKVEIAGAPEDLKGVYKTERWANSGLRYRFPVEPGKYQVLLHLAETNPTFSKAGKRVFSVHLNDKELHPEVDVFAEAGANKAWQLSTQLQVKGKEILLELHKKTAGPAVKGIEVRQLPD